MVLGGGKFSGANNPAVPHWSQIQHLAIRMTPFCRDGVACVRAACPSHVATQSSSTTIGFLARTSFKPGHGAPGTRWTVVSCTCVEKHDYNIVNFKLPFIINRARNSLRLKRGAR